MSTRVLELGVPYDVRVHYRNRDWFASPSLRAASTLGKSPVVELDGRVLTESAAILGTFLRAFPSPATEPEPSPNSLFWSHFAEGSLMLYLQPARFATLGMRQLLREDGMGGEKARGVKAMNDWFQTQVLMLFMMFFPLNSIAYGRSRPSAPRVYELGKESDAWVERMRARPAFERALARMHDEEEAQKPAEMREAEARKRAEEATIW
ncbi:hypothetical protein CspeluHIS016_0111550 [Cutaneotrichosporon spelunceum]|uniref:GST N-terminal domain-containing protein n=1 Tax=Cutaneotrichosporon spelunceum TaxID=1672016 RepID=A0AAD3TPY6_9TREE|nr:hypothetical protein CspeluHIS016_0111550 [Cutaneotrichosporon spelunceum]